MLASFAPEAPVPVSSRVQLEAMSRVFEASPSSAKPRTNGEVGESATSSGSQSHSQIGKKMKEDVSFFRFFLSEFVYLRPTAPPAPTVPVYI